MAIWEQEKFVTFFQLLTALPFWEAQQQVAVSAMHRKGSFMAKRTMPQSTGTKISTWSKGGVTAESAGSIQGQARGTGKNCSAWSPKGWYAIKNSVQQPGECWKGKCKCDMTKPRISIYLGGLQSVTKFRLIATLVRNHHYWLVYILVFNFFSLPSPSILEINIAQLWFFLLKSCNKHLSSLKTALKPRVLNIRQKHALFQVFIKHCH